MTKMKKRSANSSARGGDGRKPELYPVGGQAVIEGVMMKSPRYCSVSVRTPDKKIKTKTERYVSLSEKYKVLGWPFIRGCINLFEMFSLGLKALTYSAEQAAADEDEKLSPTATFLTVTFALAFAIAFFVLLPYIITYLFGFSEDKNSVLFNLVDGLIKIALFVFYVFLISQMKDIRRTFEYHGAEHKSVNCYEDGKELTVKNIKKYPTFHPRCGTSFIMFVFIIMILLFSLIPSLINLVFPGVSALSAISKRLIYFLARILFILPVAGVSYEVLKFSYKYRDSWLTKILLLPGWLIQKMTTKEPDARQIETAVASLLSVLEREKRSKKRAA